MLESIEIPNSKIAKSSTLELKTLEQDSNLAYKDKKKKKYLRQSKFDIRC